MNIIRSTIRKFRQNEEGIVLPLILVLLAIGMLLITPTLGHGYTSLQASTATESRAEELYAADSGIEEGLFWLVNGHVDNMYWDWDEINGTGSRDPYVINRATVTVTVQPLPALGSNYYRIDSVATGPYGTTTVLSQVWAAPGAYEGLPGGDYEGDVFVDGDGSLQAHDSITGDVVVTGDFTMNAQTDVDGDVSVHGDFTQHAQTTVTGNICAGGNVDMLAHSTLAGDIYLMLDDGEHSDIVYHGQVETGDIFVATTGTSATVLIDLDNKDECGDIYIGAGVVLTTSFHKFSNHGTVHLDWDGTTPAPPDCPEFAVGGAVINTYEIL